ncbi:MAG: hypothetical protein NVV72_16585 [Asticcacaulis sp.]|nr:hypothetical protein [Asticcacaulis sp.]
MAKSEGLVPLTEGAWQKYQTWLRLLSPPNKEEYMHAELLTGPHNYAVVQLPTRKFPGIVFQGDSLHAMLKNIAGVSLQLKDGQVELAAEELAFIQEQLAEVLSNYETVCKSHRLGLPYIGG